MPFTDAEMRQLVQAVERDDIEKLDNIFAANYPDLAQQANKHAAYFILACSYGFKVVVNKYIERRKFDQLTYYRGLYGACGVGALDIVKLLIDRFALNPNTAISEKDQIVQNVNGHKVTIDSIERYPIAIAANNDNPDVVDYLLALPGIKFVNIFSESYTSGLDQFATACMGGKGFLPLVKVYLEITQPQKEDLYKAIYLASRFGNDEAVRLIIEKYHESLDENLVTQLIDQGFADSKVYLAKPSSKDKCKPEKQRDAVIEMFSKLASIVGNPQLEHSSDEERLSDSGSRSPGHSSDSDKEPQSANSDNSPPSSPPKSAMPPKPLSEKAKRLLAKFCVDQAMCLAVAKEVKKEICDQGLTFTWYRDNENVFHKSVLYGDDFEIASYILSRYPQAVNSRNECNGNRTALHLLVAEEFSSETSYGVKASFSAEEQSKFAAVKFLLEKGADPTLTDINEKTALFYAEKNKFNNIAAVLRQHMAKKQVPSLPYPSVESPALEARPIVVSRPVMVAPVTPSTASPASTYSSLATNSNSASPAMFRPAPQPQIISYAPPPPALKPDVRIPANNSSVISQPPVKTASSEQYKDKQKSSGFKSMLKSIIPGSSSDDKKDKKEKKGAPQLSY